jgi:prevent-host-death family protein
MAYNWCTVEAMTVIPLSEARSQFFDVVERAAAGERITLTNRGVLRAMLVPVSDDARPAAFSREQAVDIFLNHQMDSAAWDDIRFAGDTIGEDSLG